MTKDETQHRSWTFYEAVNHKQRKGLNMMQMTETKDLGKDIEMFWQEMKRLVGGQSKECGVSGLTELAFPIYVGPALADLIGLGSDKGPSAETLTERDDK
jgi:hypothetical protein